MTLRVDSVFWRDTVLGLAIGDTGVTPIPTTKVLKRRRRRLDAVSGDETRHFETCNWPVPEPDAP